MRPAPPESPAVADRGLRAIAMLEGIKGLVALGLGGLIYSLQGQDFRLLATNSIARFGWDPASDWSARLLKAGSNLNDSPIGLVATLLLVYAAMRLVESYGLWRERRWAEWFGVLSGGVYIPFEIVEIMRSASLFSVAALVINILIVGYLAYRLRHPRTTQTTDR